ncbi:MAG: hypothetical protein PHH93_11455 [Prolixibacteraceae bacterium]|nr:hypothetical protein [Prolixibacteraceae bacterium]
MTYSIGEIIVAATALIGCVLGVYNAIIVHQHTKDKINVEIYIANEKNGTIRTTPLTFFRKKSLTEI